MARPGSKGGSSLLALLLLLAVLGGLGTWNYRRNAAADRAEYRPYRSYTSDDLEALGNAYTQEIEALSRRYTTASGRSVRVAHGRPLADQIREFERVQRISRATRELGQEIAQREAVLAQITAEQQRRVGESDRLRFHLQRLVTFRP